MSVYLNPKLMLYPLCYSERPEAGDEIFYQMGDWAKVRFGWKKLTHLS